jgi:hypothetical protein
MFKHRSTLALAALLLLPVTAFAWWSAPGGGYYGAGPYSSNMDGGFSFGASMHGRGSGHGYNRHGYRHGYPPYPPAWNPAPVWNKVGDNWTIRGVNFKYDSDELTPQSREILDAVAATVRNRPPRALEVGGHASAEGDTSYNQDLSERRAEAVRAYLVERGVKPQLLTWRGYGESRPLVNNFSEVGRRINRRVELRPVAPAGQRQVL